MREWELLQRELERVCPHAFFLQQGGGLLAVVNDRITPRQGFEAALGRTLESFGCGAGRSRDFTELSALKSAVTEAELA